MTDDDESARSLVPRSRDPLQGTKLWKLLVLQISERIRLPALARQVSAQAANVLAQAIRDCGKDLESRARFAIGFLLVWVLLCIVAIVAALSGAQWSPVLYGLIIGLPLSCAGGILLSRYPRRRLFRSKAEEHFDDLRGLYEKKRAGLEAIERDMKRRGVSEEEVADKISLRHEELEEWYANALAATDSTMRTISEAVSEISVSQVEKPRALPVADEDGSKADEDGSEKR
ncbi:MAG: hypothetical protein H6711_16580 [Myxococcales bacterium]|nr:hypothetical protein [Myxococcales bacterium]